MHSIHRKALGTVLPCSGVFYSEGYSRESTKGSRLDSNPVTVMATVEQVSPCLETKLGRYVLYVSDRYPAENPISFREQSPHTWNHLSCYDVSVLDLFQNAIDQVQIPDSSIPKH